MMKKQRIFGKRLSLLLAMTIISFAWSGGACGQELTTSVLVQQTPAQGGTVTPSVGVHKLELYTDLRLTAIPKPGYQFVYWIGDVSDPTSNSTTAYLDSPKIIIAVFERAEYELLVPSETSTSLPRGGLRRSPGDYSRGGISPIGGKRRHKRRFPTPPEPEEPEEPEEPDVPVPDDGEQEPDFPIPDDNDEPDFPIPDDNDEPDFPVPPIPEPATGLLLGLGGLILARKRSKK